MNILIKPRKNRYIIYAIIIALFSTIGMQISLLNINIEQIFKRLEYRSMLIYFIAILKKSISGKGETDLLYSIIGCGIFLLFLIIFSYKFSKREIVSATCLAILFGICRWIGVAFSHKESWGYFLRNKLYCAFRYMVYSRIYSICTWHFSFNRENDNRLSKEK